jgi:hypothetical protein
VSFARRYIEYVPEFLEQITARARELGMEREVAPLLHMAEDFFLAPPDDLEGDSGLHALLDEAFLAQRLIEEANDRLARVHGEGLVNVDMTRANIIAHYLVGEPLATRLEMLVDRSVGLVAPGAGWVNGGAQPARPAGQLPCMSREVSVDLRLDIR